ncbi:hypothetical protein SAMN05216184_105192 [Georgenia satyanarayanai]|uniref:Uncharacterized protein n=1 Tax=Georgenia satyanarayanai TaxID=860221 RepID=A0A2Y9BY40_9MICO|nr:hypothetical protein [Georgenia satyanarayanai]PYF99948.1 hypothetical protein A8987_105192 [Georgenia satyanarayanai]SSA41952.1 hypothetical protein SAMN05216184_105192 [Georgenia satyanarayanai]
MRFLPATVEPYVVAAERGETTGARRPAVRAVVAEYTSGRRLLTGVALWLGVVAALVVATVGCVAVLATVVGGDPVTTGVLGGLTVAVALAGGCLAALRGRDLLRAGARLSRAAEAWMTSGPARHPGLGHRVHGLLSALRPELFARVVLCSLSGLAAVLAASAVGFSLSRLGGDAIDVALNATLGVACAVLAVVCAVPAVALWRGSRRVQRGLIHDPAATAYGTAG